MNNPWVRLVFFVIVTILLMLGFEKNQWQVAEMSEILYRQDVSEIYVIGRLVKSQQDGILSAGGLLGIGDVSEYSVQGKVIKNQYKKYNNGNGFSQYWTYKSHPGFQGVTLSIFDSITNFSPMRNLAIARKAVSLLLAIVLSIFCIWLWLEVNWLASLMVFIFILVSNWMTIFGGNIYWSMWVFYLPLPFLSFLLKDYDDNRRYPFYLLLFVAFFLSLMKILFSGFEFFTAGLLIIAVPFVYYAVLNKWKWRIFFSRMMSLGISLISSAVIGLLILSIQINSVLGSYTETLQYIVFAWSKRTYGYENLLGSSAGTVKQFGANPIDVVNTYLNGYAFSLSRYLNASSTFVQDVVDGKYLFLILLFVVVTLIFFISNHSLGKTKNYQVGVALIITTWFSILGPLSWFIVFRDHAALHTRLDFIVWQMPFILYGFALIGFVLLNLIEAAQPIRR